MNRNMKKFLKAAEVAVGTGLYLLDQSERVAPGMKNKIGDQVSDLRDRAKDAYEAATDRVNSFSKAMRRNNSNRTMRNIVGFAAGIGVGIGVALLFAPANGEQTRAKIADKAQDFAANARERFNSQSLRPTGTGV